MLDFEFAVWGGRGVWGLGGWYGGVGGGGGKGAYCCSITMSLSPGPYSIFASRVAQRVSRGVPRGVILLSENSPNHRSPAMMRFFSSVSANFALEEMAHSRSLGWLLVYIYIAFTIIYAVTYDSLSDDD